MKKSIYVYASLSPFSLLSLSSLLSPLSPLSSLFSLLSPSSLLNKGIPAWDPALNDGEGGLHAEKVEECRSATVALAHCLEHDIKVRERRRTGGGRRPVCGAV